MYVRIWICFKLHQYHHDNCIVHMCHIVCLLTVLYKMYSGNIQNKCPQVLEYFREPIQVAGTLKIYVCLSKN